MTTAQQSPNGHKIFPPPCSVENPKQPDPADLPTNKANNNQFASDDQVVERQKGVSPRESHGDQELSRVTKSTPLLAHEKVQIDTNALPERCQFDQPTRMVVPSDEPERGISPEPLPDRCQFTFSDGRQCSMARSDIHPSLCRFHAEREEQLFGDPAPGGNVVGAALDLPELHSACRDLTTAAGVNRALAQVFRLLAQRRISRQEAATFGHLAQLLLRTISAMRVLAGENPAANVYPLARESHGHQELSPDNKVAAPADQERQQIEQHRHADPERQECDSSPAA